MVKNINGKTFILGLFLFSFSSQASPWDSNIFEAIQSGSLERVKEVLSKQGVDVLNDKNEEDLTPFLFATKEGKTQILKFIFEKNKKKLNSKEMSKAIYLATENGHEHIATFLKEKTELSPVLALSLFMFVGMAMYSLTLTQCGASFN